MANNNTTEARITPALLDKRDAADYLGTSERHVQRLWTERRIPAVRVGRKVRFRVTDLDAWIATHTVQAVGE